MFSIVIHSKDETNNCYGISFVIKKLETLFSKMRAEEVIDLLLSTIKETVYNHNKEGASLLLLKALVNKLNLPFQFTPQAMEELQEASKNFILPIISIMEGTVEEYNASKHKDLPKINTSYDSNLVDIRTVESLEEFSFFLKKLEKLATLQSVEIEEIEYEEILV